MTSPTYDLALAVSTLTAVEADLLSRLDPTTVAGWPASAPQRQLVSSEAVPLQFLQLQRAILTRTASPAQARQLRAFLISQGYTAGEAAAVASAWVDIVLERYGTWRAPAQKAAWAIPLTGSGSVSGTSIVLQADDGALFVSAQASPVSLPGTVAFAARTAGLSGNVIAGSITQIIAAPANVAGVGVGAQLLTSAGRDTESDEDALDRATNRWGTLSGVLTVAGWKYVLTAPELAGSVPTLTRVFVDDANPAGPNSVGLGLANGAGAATADEVAAATVQAARYSIAGMGPVLVYAAPQLTLAIAATVKTDGSNPLAAAQAASALVQLGARTLPPVLYLDQVIATLMGVAGVVNVPSLSLSADVAIPGGTALVISPTVTAL